MKPADRPKSTRHDQAIADPGHPAHRNACGRAERLWGRFLSISGHRWAEPRAVDVKREVSQMDPGRFVPDEVAFCTDFTARGCWAWIDPSHLRETVLALILNAQAAVSAGGMVLLRIDLLGRTPTKGGSADGWVELEVADNGIGMDPGTLDSAVLPFFSTREPARGRGLGLSIAHGVIRQAGGVMEITSAPGTGTSVRFWLPALDGAARR